ncbi:hypothetical protein AB4Z54_06135, partial [Streptomyces sp. MCAF7]
MVREKLRLLGRFTVGLLAASMVALMVPAAHAVDSDPAVQAALQRILDGTATQADCDLVAAESS